MDAHEFCLRISPDLLFVDRCSALGRIKFMRNVVVTCERTSPGIDPSPSYAEIVRFIFFWRKGKDGRDWWLLHR